jgi:hypothetical protein
MRIMQLGTVYSRAPSMSMQMQTHSNIHARAYIVTVIQFFGVRSVG